MSKRCGKMTNALRVSLIIKTFFGSIINHRAGIKQADILQTA